MGFLGLSPQGSLSLPRPANKPWETSSDTISPYGGFPVYDSRAVVPNDPVLIVGHGGPLIAGEQDWPSVDTRNLKTKIRNLHPEYFNQRSLSGFEAPPFFNGIGGRDILDFSAALGIAGSYGFHWDVFVFPPDQRPNRQGLSGYLDSLSGDRRWTKPSGTVAENPIEANNSRDMHGNLVRADLGDFYNYSLTQHSPNVRRFFNSVIRQNILWGSNSIPIDAPMSGFRNGKGDYSQWSVNDFQDYLSELPKSRLEELGIDDPGGFDIREYAKEIDTLDEDDRKRRAREDQMLFEFFLMSHQKFLEIYREFSKQAHDTGNEHDITTTIHGLQDNHLNSKSVSATILGRAMDLIEAEIAPTIPGHPGPTGGPGIRSHIHKLTNAQARALGKPMIEHGFLHAHDARGLDPEKDYPNLVALNCAETYANGCRRQLDLSGWGGEGPDSVSLLWVNPATGDIPSNLQNLADFLWLHSDKLSTTPESDVGIVYSLPTLLARQRDDFGTRMDREEETMFGVVRALREAQIPSEYVIFGQPSLWDDSRTLKHLDRYDVLVFPGVTNLTDNQVTAVDGYLQSGGHLIHEGELASFDHKNRPRDAPVFDDYESQLTALDGKANSAYREGNIEPVIDVIESGIESRQLRVSKPYPISAEITRQDGRIVVHLLNYDYEASTDTITPKKGIQLSLRKDKFRAERAYVVTPEQPSPTELEINESDSYVEVRIPEINIWSLIIFESAQVTATPEISRSEVRPKLRDAETAVERAKMEDRNIGLFEAEVSLREATLASDASQYKRAKEVAIHSEQTANVAVGTPVIGIDAGHEQVGAFSYSELGRFRDLLRERVPTTFKRVNSYDRSQLANIDALIIPHTDTFSVSSAEIQELLAWVRNGGGLAIAAVPRPNPSELNNILESFGFRILEKPLLRANGPINEDVTRDLMEIRPTQYRSELTYQVFPHVQRQLVGMEVLDDEVDIWAKTEEAHLNGSSNIGRYPVYVSTTHGQGRVACTSWQPLLTSPEYQNTTISRNVLRWIVSPNLESEGTPNFSVADTQISSHEVAPGESVIMTVSVKNIGNGAGTYNLKLTVKGKQVEQRHIDIEPGSQKEVTFRITFDEVGQYRLAINGEELTEISVSERETSMDWTDVKTPGFGVTSAIGGIGGAMGYILYRNRDSNE